MTARLLIVTAFVLLPGCANTTSPPLDATGTVACVAVSSFTLQTTTVYIHADKPGRAAVKPDCSVEIVVLPAAPVAEPVKAAP